MAPPPLQLAVIGGAAPPARHEELAHAVGREIARRGAVLLCGGGGGVMAAAARGAREAGGRSVGILPGASARDSPPNPHLEIVLFTGMGQARNLILVLSAAAVIGIGGEWGTLSEIALARKHGIPVVLLDSWTLGPPGGRGDDPGLRRAEDPAAAVALALELAAEAAA